MDDFIVYTDTDVDLADRRLSDASHARVERACDRCRMKKCKCDGGLPCTRCGKDNFVCHYSERKPYPTRNVPKGYVEFLEIQQSHLAAALTDMYQRLVTAGAWPGSVLARTDESVPLLHDILATLNLPEDDVGSLRGSDYDANVMHMQERREADSFTERRDSLTAVTNQDRKMGDCATGEATTPSPASSGAVTAPESQPRLLDPSLVASAQAAATGSWWPANATTGTADFNQFSCLVPSSGLMPANVSAQTTWYSEPAIDQGQRGSLAHLAVSDTDLDPGLWAMSEYVPELAPGIMPEVALSSSTDDYHESDVLLGRPHSRLAEGPGSEGWPLTRMMG